MKIIIGLGNGGVALKGTRHNIGHMFIEFVSYFNTAIETIDGNVVLVEHGGNLYMNYKGCINKSGSFVKKVCKIYESLYDELIIVHDDIDLKLGNVKYKTRGSSGGHNGIKDIIKELGTTNFSRVKIGIGRPDDGLITEYVLGKFTDKELGMLAKHKSFERAFNFINTDNKC